MKINAGIIGMGIGQKHFDAIEGYKKSRVSIICEKNKNKLNILKKKYPNKLITNDENKIFEDKKINLVSIASYDNYHFYQIEKGLKNKKNLIIEKPLCLNLSELKKIKNLLQKNKNISITSNLVLRVNSLFQKLKKITNNINKIYYIEGDYIWGRRQKLYGWRSKIKNYSLIHGAAIHMIDLIMWLTGLKPKTVYCVGKKKFTKNSKFKKNNLVVILFEFPKDILVKVSANALATHNHFHELKVYYDNKTFVNNNLGSYIYKNKKMLNIKSKYPDNKNKKKMIQNFIDNIKNKKIKKIISHREQIDLMSVCFAAERSMILNKKIKIKYIL